MGKSTLKTARAENDTAVKKAYLQHILETKSNGRLLFGSQGTVGLPRDYDKKGKLLFFVQAKTKLEKQDLANIVREILTDDKIKAFNPKGDPGTFIVDTKNIIVPEGFIKGMRDNKGQPTKPGKSKTSDDVPVKTGHDAILEALNLHDVTYFEEEKSRTDTSVKIILPEDSSERVYAKLVLSQFAFEVEDCEKYCLKVLVNNKTVDDIVFVPGLEKPDKMRFGTDLVSAINITAFELQRQHANVDTFVFDLAGEATKSTPFKFIKGSSSLKPEAQAQDFINYMMNTYGVDIQAEVKDPHICRVVSPKDPDHAGTSDAQEKRQRKQRDSHPITVYLVKNGVPMSVTGSDGGIYGILHLSTSSGLPESITFVRAKDLEERIAFAKKVCDLLNADPEMAKYGAVQDEKTPQKVVFKPQVRRTRSDAHPLYAELAGLGFTAYTRKLAKENQLHFLVRFAQGTKNATAVSFYGGTPESVEKEAKRLEKYFNSTSRPAKAEEGKVKLETPIPFNQASALPKKEQPVIKSRKAFIGPQTHYRPDGDPFIDSIDEAYLVRIKTDKNLQVSVLAVLTEVLPEAFKAGGFTSKELKQIIAKSLKELLPKSKDIIGKKMFFVEDVDSFVNSILSDLQK